MNITKVSSFLVKMDIVVTKVSPFLVKMDIAVVRVANFGEYSVMETFCGN